MDLAFLASLVVLWLMASASVLPGAGVQPPAVLQAPPAILQAPQPPDTRQEKAVNQIMHFGSSAKRTDFGIGSSQRDTEGIPSRDPHWISWPKMTEYCLDFDYNHIFLLIVFHYRLCHQGWHIWGDDADWLWGHGHQDPPHQNLQHPRVPTCQHHWLPGCSIGWCSIRLCLNFTSTRIPCNLKAYNLANILIYW